MGRLLLSFMMLFIITSGFGANKDLEIIRNRIKENYMRGAINSEFVQSKMNSLKTDGSWPDIDYADTRRIAFQHSQHLSYMVAMSRAYSRKDSPLYKSSALKEKLFAAIDFWTEHDFICENWWNNEVGTPTSMLTILYNVDEELGKARSDKMVAIASRANMQASGARPSGDRVKLASLCAETMLWKRDSKNVEKIIRIISDQMRYLTKDEYDILMASNPNFLGGGRGLQPDFSFHHRADRVNNTLTYGTSHASTFAKWALMANDTKYRFSDESVRLLVDYFLDGVCKQRCFALMDDPGLLNRDAARPKAGSRTDTSMAETLLKLTDYRKNEVTSVLDQIKGGSSTPQSFAKTFFSTEYFSFQRPSYFASVRMYSTRNASMEEPYNGEGIVNHYRADGTNYLTLKGDEYLNIYPTFDFRKVPGITSVQKNSMPDENLIRQWGVTDFVGGVDDGLYGAAAFDFVSPLDKVKAKKSWFFFDDCYVCLGSGISYEGNEDVYTTINQCFLKGDVYYGTELGSAMKLASGKHDITNISWVNHNNVGYIFPNVCKKVYLQNENIEGSWTRFNRQTTVSKKIYNNDMFTLSVNHGAEIKDREYAYIVLPGADITKTQSFCRNNNINILSNTKDIQAVAYNGVNYAVFYSKGEVVFDKKLSVSVDKPCMVLVKDNGNSITEIVVSDPSRKTEKISLSIDAYGDKKSYNVTLPMAELGGSSIKVNLQ